MATAPDPQTVVKVTERLWSEEVAAAEATQLQPRDTAYQFSNGRRFEEKPNPYEDPAP
jgi:hypothetical protein